MPSALQIALVLLSFVTLGSFVGGFAASIMLIPHLDAEKVKKKTGRAFFWQFGNATVPVECYREAGHTIWKLRDRCLKTFVICVGLVVLLAVTAAIFDIPLDFHK